MNPIRPKFPLLAVVAVLGLVACQQAQPPARSPLAAHAAAPGADPDPVARGEYLVRISGCNDCHTPGYAESGGQLGTEHWLTGSPVGWNGPWGTTYAANLRLKVGGMDEATWLKYSGELHTRPPMPDFNLRAMTQQDRRAIYRFIRSLGPAGVLAPAYQPPGQNPKAPYVRWVLPTAPVAAVSADKG